MRAALRVGLVVGVVVVSAGVGLVAQQAACHMAEMTAGPTLAEKLPVPVRMTGIGNGHIEITSSSAEAKMWFDQGLNLLHDFWDYESEKAFEQSVRLDPKCAMCWWGLAKAEGFLGVAGNQSDAALKQAVTLAKDKKNVTPAERLCIKAAVEAAKEKSASRSSNGPNTGGKAGTEDVPHKDSKETKVLRKLVVVAPDDVMAKIMLAESLMDGFKKDGTPKAGTVEGQAILVAVLKAHPDDSAANHYWIHAVEPSLTPERALESSRKLGLLTPASGHMVHMPGHIFYRTGDYETARVSFENSMHVDEEYMRVQGVQVEDDWNYVHNLMYLIADLLEAGRIEEATAISAKLNAAHGQRGTSLYQNSARDQMTRLDEELPVVLRAGEWTRAVAMLEKSTPPAEWVNLVELKNWLLEYVRGMAAVNAGDVSGAMKFSAVLDARVKAADAAAKAAGVVPASSTRVMAPTMGMNKKDALPGPLHKYMDVAALELRASLEMAQGKAADADATFAKAADAERELGYREPPFYIRPVAESRGDALMRAKRYADAKAAYEVALKERPNSGYPLYGIALAEAAAGDVTGAMATYGAMLMAWAKADAGLPQVVAARAWVAGHGESISRGE